LKGPQLQALGDAVGSPLGVARKAVPTVNRGKPPCQPLLAGTALVLAHSRSDEHFVQQHGVSTPG
jgi:hypothetical protein